jgi:hypothetical protein
MVDIHEGGCACGAVRYRVKGSPERASVCHCTFCQRRTGSAFGISVYFHDETSRSFEVNSRLTIIAPTSRIVYYACSSARIAEPRLPGRSNCCQVHAGLPGGHLMIQAGSRLSVTFGLGPPILG